jgi:hypothetical protein
MFKCLGHLDNDMARKLLAEICQADDLMEKLSTRGQLQDDVVVLPGLGEVDELDNVGVVHLFHDLDLLQDVFSL